MAINYSLIEPDSTKGKGKKEVAIFAAGCFWHIEDVFNKVDGVQSTRAGYIGGKMKGPTYQNVCSGESGHVEAVEVVFIPTEVSYDMLLDIFWNIHDPTTKDRQGVDVGSQYNSVIFYTNAKQKSEAEKSKKERQKTMKKPILTAIKKATTFWPAEEYHQKYFKKQHGF